MTEAVAGASLFKKVIQERCAGPHAPALPAPMPRLPRAGTGKRVLGELCEEYGFASEQVIGVLADAGIEAQADATLKDIAERSGSSPGEVYEVIRLALVESR